ncbi:MAG: hypothetical protein ABIN95_08020 [Mucilaginibacter sp.]
MEMLLIFAVAVLIGLGLLIVLLIFIYNRFLRIGYPKTGITVAIAIFALIAYPFYTAFYPNDNFYFDEFKTITLIQAPPSADIICKVASYPDQHGDYSAAALIKLSKKDYRNLSFQLSNDKRMKESQIIHNEEFNEVIGDLKENHIKQYYIREVEDESYYLYIGLIDDGQSIIINRVSY